MAGQGRLPRSVRDLGQVDVEGLIMSLRSRLDVEVAYALNAIMVLSAGINAPGFTFLLGLCEDLADELLDLLEEKAMARHEPFGDEDDNSLSPMPIPMPEKALSQAEWVHILLQHEENCDEAQRRSHLKSSTLADGRAPSVEGDTDQMEPDELSDSLSTTRSQSKQADTALLVLGILRNLATIPGNIDFLNEQPRLFEVLMNVMAAIESDEQHRQSSRSSTKQTPHVNGHVNGHASPSASCDGRIASPKPVHQGEPNGHVALTAFTTAQALRVRKDVLSIIASLGKEKCYLATMDATTIKAVVAFLASFIEDADEVESQQGTVFREFIKDASSGPEMQPVMRKVPFLSDMALEAFSSIAQPDANRHILSEILNDDEQVELSSKLVRLLPVSDVDFQMLKTETRLAYCERIAMSLFSIAFMSNASVKRRIRTLPGGTGVILRCIKRLMRVNPDFSNNPFSVLTRRLAETLRILNNDEVLFDRPALLGFGMASSGALPSSDNSSSYSSMSSGSGKLGGQGSLLINEEAAIVDLMTLEGADPAVIAEFEQML